MRVGCIAQLVFSAVYEVVLCQREAAKIMQNAGIICRAAQLQVTWESAGSSCPSPAFYTKHLWFLLIFHHLQKKQTQLVLTRAASAGFQVSLHQLPLCSGVGLSEDAFLLVSEVCVASKAPPLCGVFPKCWWWLTVLYELCNNASSNPLRAIEIVACLVYQPTCGVFCVFLKCPMTIILSNTLCMRYLVNSGFIWLVEFLSSRSSSPHYLSSVLKQNNGRSLKGNYEFSFCCAAFANHKHILNPRWFWFIFYTGLFWRVC